MWPMATILDGAVKAFAWMERREIRRYFYFSYFSHCIWKDHDCSLVMYKNGTFYKQQVGGAPAAGFAGFSNSANLVLINISQHIV